MYIVDYTKLDGYPASLRFRNHAPWSMPYSPSPSHKIMSSTCQTIHYDASQIQLYIPVHHVLFVISKSQEPRCGLFCALYTGQNRVLYVSFENNAPEQQSRLNTCVGDIRNCLANNMLKLNETEVILFTSKHALKSSIGVTVGEQPVRS